METGGLVFVYGTLRRGLVNHGLLRYARYLGIHVTHAAFTMLDLGAYPGVIAGGTTPITGEVYTVNARTLHRLDMLEDYPHLYTRVTLATAHGNAWMYVYRGRSTYHPVVASGDWCRRGSLR